MLDEYVALKDYDGLLRQLTVIDLGHFDLQLTLMAGSLYRLLARRIGREYERAQPKTIFRNLLDLSGNKKLLTRFA